MSWLNELKDEIVFKSPNGNNFYALWRQNESRFEKKLGIFSIPKFNGDIVQDMGSKSLYYPITAYFDGMSHNRDAKEFIESLSTEFGQWEVVHPVKGPLILQLISCREIMNPVDNGNYTGFEMEWIKPANLTRLISLEELAAAIISAVLVLAEDLTTQLKQIRSDAYATIQSVINTLNKIAGFMDSVISEIAATVALAQESYNSARAAFDNAIENFGIGNSDPSDIASAMVDMATAPLQATTDFTTVYTGYSTLTADIITLAPENTSDEDYNVAQSQDFGVSVSLLAIGQSITTSVFASRSEIISAMENLKTVFDDSVNAMDLVQDAFSSVRIDFQYYSQSQSYTSLLNLYTLLMRYLIGQFYNLKSEKIFTLKNRRSPLEIAVTEYGELGEDDFYYDLFLTSNHLSGKDILLLPAGREVLVYVG